MSDRHSEVEYKFPAEKVAVDKFVKWAMYEGPQYYKRILSPDLYYVNGDNTIRHRWCDKGGAGELTVKRRKDKKLTTDRVEIDLFFNHKTTREDVTEFLKQTGWTRAFTIVKEAHIFEFMDCGARVSVVIYDCWKIEDNGTVEGSQKRFIEIEAAKGTSATLEADKAILEKWRKEIERRFPEVGAPSNKSLYELYSGKKYRIYED